MASKSNFCIHACVKLLLIVLILGSSQLEAQNVSREIRAVAVLEPPFVIQDKSTGLLSGLMIDVLNETGIEIDHTNVPVADVDGWEDQNGVADVLRDIAQNKYDIAIGPFSVRSEFAKHVTFTQAVGHAGYVALYKLPKEWKTVDVAGMSTMIKPFSPLLWGLIILVCLISSFVLLLIRRYSPYEDTIATTSVNKGDFGTARMTWGTSFLYMMSTILGQSYNTAPRSTSGRILTAVWWLFSLMTIAAYTSSLIVILFKSNSHYKELPFTTLREITKQSDVKVLGVKSSATFNYIKSQSGTWEKKIYEMWKRDWDTLMVDSMKTALKMLEEGDGKYAVFMDEARASYLAGSKPCNKMIIGAPVGDMTFSYACPKGSSLCEELNHKILKLREDGRAEEIIDKWFSGSCDKSVESFSKEHSYLETSKEPFQTVPTAINLERFAGAFIILLVGIGFALCILALEMIYSKRRRSIPYLMKGRGCDGDMQFITSNDSSLNGASPNNDRDGI